MGSESRVLVSDLLGKFTDIFLNRFIDKYIFMDRDDIEVVKSTYNKTMEYINKSKNGRISGEGDLNRKPLYITVDPQLSDIKYSDIDNLPGRNAFITKYFDGEFNTPIVDLENFKLVPHIQKCEYSLNIKINFDSFYKYLDHYLYFKYAFMGGGDDIRRKQDISDPFCLNIFLDSDLSFIKNPIERNILHEYLVNYADSNIIKFINSRNGFSLPYSVYPSVYVESVSGNPTKSKNNLMDYSTVDIQFKISLQIPIMMSIYTSYIIDQISIITSSGFYSSYNTYTVEYVNELLNSKNDRVYTLDPEMSNVISFENDIDSYEFITGISDPENYDKYSFIVIKNDDYKNPLFDGSLFKDLSNKSAIYLNNVKSGDKFDIYGFYFSD